jgi:hypothetical protein
MPGMANPAAVSTLIQYCAIGALTTCCACASASHGAKPATETAFSSAPL